MVFLKPLSKWQGSDGKCPYEKSDPKELETESEEWRTRLTSASTLPCQVCKETLDAGRVVGHLKESHGVAFLDYYARIVKPWVEAAKAKVEQDVIDWANK